jgi:hypothetical protein
VQLLLVGDLLSEEMCGCGWWRSDPAQSAQRPCSGRGQWRTRSCPPCAPAQRGPPRRLRRPWSPEDDTVVASPGQRLPRTASDEVARAPRRLQPCPPSPCPSACRVGSSHRTADAGLLACGFRAGDDHGSVDLAVRRAMARVSSVLVSSSCSSTRKSWSAFCCWKVAWRF